MLRTQELEKEKDSLRELERKRRLEYIASVDRREAFEKQQAALTAAARQRDEEEAARRAEEEQRERQKKLARLMGGRVGRMGGRTIHRLSKALDQPQKTADGRRSKENMAPKERGE